MLPQDTLIFLQEGREEDVVFGMYDLRLVSPIGDQAGLVLSSESLIQLLDETARPLGLEDFTESALYL